MVAAGAWLRQTRWWQTEHGNVAAGGSPGQAGGEMLRKVLIKTDLKSRGVPKVGRDPTTGLAAANHNHADLPSGGGLTSGGMPAMEPVAFKEFQDLFQSRLSPSLIRLVAQLTGVRLHIWWHGPLDFPVAQEASGQCPAESTRAAGNERRPRVCECCLQGHWSAALATQQAERRFFGKCGLTNFCARLQVDNVHPLTLVLQARVAPPAAATNPDGEGESRGWGSKAGGPLVSPADFRQAIALVRLVRHDLEAMAQAWRTGRDLELVSRRLSQAETEVARWRGELCQRLPALPPEGVQPQPGSRAEKLVARMLDYVQQHSHHPISLGELAAAMQMNASYLSDVFRRTTGMTFQHYLQEVRLAKARMLLRDPRLQVREVARVAGYASPDAFRHAFKAHAGVSPEAWRTGSRGGKGAVSGGDRRGLAAARP